MHGLEVKASARWMYPGQANQPCLNFVYSVRIQMVDNDSVPWETCQLVGRHWEFTNGRGVVSRVTGDGVVGKQPVFFRANGKGGFVDLGASGDGLRYADRLFVYQSQNRTAAE